MSTSGPEPHLTDWDGSYENGGSRLLDALSGLFPCSTHPGGLVWEISTGQLPEWTVLAETPSGVTGWAAFSADDARLECAPDDQATTAALLSWLFDMAAGTRFSVAVHRAQHGLREALHLRGFVEEDLPLAGVSHPAGDTRVQMPSGYSIRPMEDGEETQRIATHRQAWKPVDLPFTDDSASGIDPHAESRFDASALESMQTGSVYRSDLDLVIEAPDGSLAGCCTVWLDTATGWAELEPLGIVPEHRHRGLSKALALDACRRVGELGGHSVFINCAPLPYYRAPWDAYLKAGFTPMDRGIRMSRAETADAA